MATSISSVVRIWMMTTEGDNGVGEQGGRLNERRVSSREIYDGRILRLTVHEVELPNGRRSVREVVEHANSVCIAPVDDQMRIVLVRQYRYPVGGALWELPAGKQDRGEDPFSCAVRELEEETGLQAREWERLATFYTTPGFCNEMMTLFLARNLVPGTKNPDFDEFIEIRRVSLREARDWVWDGRVADLKTIVGICMVYERLGLE